MTESVTSNALIGTGIEFDGIIRSNYLPWYYAKRTKKRATSRDRRTFLRCFDEILVSNLEFFENQVWTTQANSEHIFPTLSDLSINLRAAYSQAYRDAPYETSFTYVREDASLPFRSAIGLGAGSSSAGLTFAFEG